MRIARGTAVAILSAWALSGLYGVPAGQVSVVQWFGRFVATSRPGLHYHLPWPMETATAVDIAGVRRLEIGYRTVASVRSAPTDTAPLEWSAQHSGSRRRVAEEALLLTGDANLVDANLTLQYRVRDPMRFLFRSADAENTLRQTAEAAFRRAVGESSLESLLTTGRAALEAAIVRAVQADCDQFETGLLVTQARLQEVHPPEEVVAAYRDVSSAAEEKATAINQAEAVRNETIPAARGQAAQNIAGAKAYTFDRIHRSAGSADRFIRTVEGYHLGPQVNAYRLYLETVEQALAPPTKFVMDPNGGGRRQMWLTDGGLNGLPGLPAPEPAPRLLPPVEEETP